MKDYDLCKSILASVKIIPVKKWKNCLSSIQVLPQLLNENPWGRVWGGYGIQEDARESCRSCWLPFTKAKMVVLTKANNTTTQHSTMTELTFLFQGTNSICHKIVTHKCVHIPKLLHSPLWLSTFNSTYWTHLQASYFAIIKFGNTPSWKIKAEVQITPDCINLIKPLNISRHNKIMRSVNTNDYY